MEVAAADEKLGDQPVAVALLVHGDVFDDGVAAAVHQGHLAVEELPDHQHLCAALFEAAQVDQAGADDLRLVHGGHPGHRHEDALLPGDLDDDADHVRRRAALPAREHHDIAQSAQPVTQRVENVESEQTRNKDA